VRKINIIHVGGIKAQEKYFSGAIDEYIKRLSGGFKIAQTEINAGSAALGAARIIKAEGGKILEKINPAAFKIALCVEGEKLTSEKFAALLYKHGCVDFIIGGAYGLCADVKKSADYLLSLSDMTFSHRLARVMLAEQIYRAYSIETGKKYHK
jgi:23S rRNA (pseudouridine1915-N3)-methyltransferase